jgi:hypothetical protein
MARLLDGCHVLLTQSKQSVSLENPKIAATSSTVSNTRVVEAFRGSLDGLCFMFQPNNPVPLAPLADGPGRILNNIASTGARAHQTATFSTPHYNEVPINRSILVRQQTFKHPSKPKHPQATHPAQQQVRVEVGRVGVV